MRLAVLDDRRKNRVRRWFYDFWDDYSGNIAVTLYGVVIFFLAYGLWVIAR